MIVHIYVEGGGDRRDISDRCKEGFREFFKRALPGRLQPRVIPCGSGEAAFERFKTALAAGNADFVVLLVDSEAPVRDKDGPWEHLARQTQGRWSRPGDADPDGAHLMVQCMESWFLADREALQAFYGTGFRARSLPAAKRIEAIDKAAVLRGLAAATASVKMKGQYHKTEHGFRLLAAIDSEKVRRAAPHAARLLALLERKLATRKA